MKQVFLAGDSIRMGYAPFVRDMLKDTARVHEPGENGRFSLNTLCLLPAWAARMREETGVPPEAIDLVHWNNGLWDVCHFMGDPQPLVSPALYRETLRRLCGRMRVVFPRAKLVFALTTGVDEANAKVERGLPIRTNKEIEAYNRVALEVMAEERVAVNRLDLYARTLPDTLRADWVHYTPCGYRLLGEEVATAIRRALTTEEKEPVHE